MTSDGQVRASFRDPSGFLFTQEGTLYRQVNRSYQDDYDLLMRSGLYERLVKSKKLIPHQEVDLTFPAAPEAYRVIQPERVDFISYPYEWCFSQLKDAALLTLSIQKTALKHGLCLKDASAYNIQFQQVRPILIDTLSFTPYREGEPWMAYRQFCQHFLGPLALIAYGDVRLSQLLRIHIDGLPLDLTSKLLPWHTHLRFGLLTHIHLHAKAQKIYADKPDQAQRQVRKRTVSKVGLQGLVDSLNRAVENLTWEPKDPGWSHYYGTTNYSPGAFEQKIQIVRSFLARVQPGRVWDLGANTGVFSRLASEMGILTLSTDFDEAVVEKNYREMRQKQETHLLPLVLDLANPSPAIGWLNEERDSFLDRGPADAVMALALIHHLAIGNNVPLSGLAEFFSRLGGWLIVEFIPKEDSQVERLLASRKDIFSNYTQEGFEQAFCQAFMIRESIPIQGSQRVMYLMEKRSPSDPP
jgi:hypothetical protein